jgi:hypothetical protein
VLLMLAGAASAAERNYDMVATGRTITIHFADDGAYAGYDGEDVQATGDPVPATGAAMDSEPAAAEPVIAISATRSSTIPATGAVGARSPEITDLADSYRILYGDVVLTGARCHFVQAEFPGTNWLVPQSGTLDSGPGSMPPDILIFDSRQSTLPRLAFHGIIPARAVAMAILPATTGPAEQPVAHYRADLEGIGDFSGRLRSAHGWNAYDGWADHARIRFAAEVTRAGLHDLRLESVIIFGSAAPDGHPGRPAMLRRPQIVVKTL